MIISLIKKLLVVAVVMECLGLFNAIINRVFTRGHSDLVDTMVFARHHLGNYFVAPLFRMIWQSTKQLGKGFLAMIVEVFQIPIDIIWSLIPGLSHIPLPSFAHTIGLN